MNAMCNFVGFVHEPPNVGETKNGKPFALFCLDVYRDEGRDPVGIPVRVVGSKAVEMVQKHMTTGTLIEADCLPSNLRPTVMGGIRMPSIVFDLRSFEVVDRPKLPGLSAEEFVRQYSQEATAYREAFGKAPPGISPRSKRGKGGKK